MRVRLIEIGEAVKDIDPELLSPSPESTRKRPPPLVAAAKQLSASIDDDLDS